MLNRMRRLPFSIPHSAFSISHRMWKPSRTLRAGQRGPGGAGPVAGITGLAGGFPATPPPPAFKTDAMPIERKSRREIELMRRAGWVGSQILNKMREATAAGVSTLTLDELAAT